MPQTCDDCSSKISPNCRVHSFGHGNGLPDSGMESNSTGPLRLPNASVGELKIGRSMLTVTITARSYSVVYVKMSSPDANVQSSEPWLQQCPLLAGGSIQEKGLQPLPQTTDRLAAES